MDAELYDKIAEAELHHLERALGEIDPDEVDVDLSQGVLTLEFSDGEKVIVNSHRAAGEIWMAAFRQAWHFAPREDGGRWLWRVTAHGTESELRTTLAGVLSKKLGHPVAI